MVEISLKFFFAAPLLVALCGQYFDTIYTKDLNEFYFLFVLKFLHCLHLMLFPAHLPHDITLQ